MASFQISNAPKNLSMLDMRAKMDTLGGPAYNCRFAVRILPAGGTDNFLNSEGNAPIMNDMTYLCESVNFPGRGFDFMESRYYGPSQILPFNSKYSNETTLTILTRGQAFERQLFDDWLEIINPTNTFDFNYASTYYCKLQIFQLGISGKKTGGRQSPSAPEATYMWELHQAWPVSVNEQAVTWADNDILRLQVTFTYRYWNRPNRDTTSGGAGRPLS